ncbi:hypothetical protein A3Q34_04875 [Colwellia sp. PAMC 20917]|uniref:hypothetical protein n=1 Tax=Colwellia sp. PAMC 20917 TaxID=1816218 RepID=UPI0008785AD0|nr:hypothetical protein [Colwellia sp. PAMC 20917]AOW76248.1 hypothetical protein A3Q34_04875 [Colwellia sp. PAMC 20917]
MTTQAKTSTKKVGVIIHGAATSSALVGAGLAQLPGADMPVIAGFQTAMIVAIADQHGIAITRTAATDLILVFTASYGGRAISQFLIGWIPGWGNSLNATTAFTITEAIGWAANTYFES